MLNFDFCSPTRILFGQDALEDVGELASGMGKRILLHYGGGSAVRSGLLSRVTGKLEEAGVTVIPLGGVCANPVLSLVYKGIEMCRNERIDAIVAVGGGSVIDSAKAIAAGVPYGGDVWDFYCGKPVEEALPIGVVLTIPAAGSEGSRDSVITREDGLLKRGAHGDCLRPVFAAMNPEWTFTLPAYQTACGVSDICAHVLERYFTNTRNVDVTDRMCEALLQSLLKAAPAVIANPEDYDSRAEIMWAGTLAHNGLVGVGRVGDWASHLMAMEISALYDTAHGATLSVIFPAWMRYVYKHNIRMSVQFAVRVMNVRWDSCEEAMALEGINRYEEFLRSIGLPTRMGELNAKPEDYPVMADKCTSTSAFVGNYVKIDRLAAETIYKMAT